MRIKFDTHTHTIASTHAYSTVSENASFAAKIGMDGIAVTDHAPTLPDAPHEWHFRNLKNLPTELFGKKILTGVELNILDLEGNVDLQSSLLQKLDVVNASIHRQAYKDCDAKDHTSAYEAVIKNPDIDIICHSGSPDFAYDYEYIVRLAAEYNKLIEINNHTFFVRSASVPNCRRIAELCKKHGTGIVVSSDAHFYMDIGNYSKALELLYEIDFPNELIMNRSYDVFKEFMETARGKKLGQHRLETC